MNRIWLTTLPPWQGSFAMIAGCREAQGREVSAALGEACGFVRTDVTDEAQIRALLDFTLGKHGRVDCLFNNAGGPAPPGGIESIPAEGFDAAIATLLRSVLLGIKHVALVMTRCVAMQLGEQGVRVNSISPGGIATGMFGKVAALTAGFLASDDSTFVNGHDLVVDGGLIGGQRWNQQQERLQAMRAAFFAQQG